MAVSVEELVLLGRRRLTGAPFAPSPREAALLLGHVLSLSEAQVLAHGEEPVEKAAVSRFHHLLDRRLAGEPVAYLLGEREFYGRPFYVDRRVLIPRPETEHLVEEALAWDLPAKSRILDLGTGSACLAVTLALETDATVVAVDISPAALAVAAANVHRHGVGDQVRLVAADLASSLVLSAFDLVVSNPPYVGLDEASVLSPEVREFEPNEALFAPDASDSFLRRLLAELDGLQAGVPLILEIGYLHGAGLIDLSRTSAFEVVKIGRDYAGKDRIGVLQNR